MDCQGTSVDQTQALGVQKNPGDSPVPEVAKGSQYMSVKQVGEKYKCDVCGNEVTVTKVGGGTLVCCGQDMKKV